jgi:hypothetical protein
VPRLGNRLDAVIAGHFHVYTQAPAEWDIVDQSPRVAPMPWAGFNADAARIRQVNHLNGVFLVEVDRAVVGNDGPCAHGAMA